MKQQATVPESQEAHTQGASDLETPALVSLSKWGRQIGRTPPTIWRWRQLGWLDGITNIAGKPYITRQGMEKFLRRAQAGEFSKPSHAPRRLKSSLA